MLRYIVKYWSESSQYGNHFLQGGHVVSILLGNKVDLCPFERQVDQRDALTLARNFGMEYFETSALTKERVTDAFNFLIYRAWIEKLMMDELKGDSSSELSSGFSLTDDGKFLSKLRRNSANCCL